MWGKMPSMYILEAWHFRGKVKIRKDKERLSQSEGHDTFT